MQTRFLQTPTLLKYCLLFLAFVAAPLASAATFNVNSTADSVDSSPGDGQCLDAIVSCTLRAAIEEANAIAGPDTIVLGPGTYLLAIPGNNEQNAATGDLDVRNPLTIIGAGASTTIIDANGLDRVFEIANAGDVSLSGITMQNGIAGQNTPGYFVNYVGGAIFHVGTPSVLTLQDIVIRNCTATDGGAIFNIFSTLVLKNSALYNNNASAGNGGAIAEGLADYTRVYNSTLSANSATGSGGALSTSNNSTVLNNVTITNNVADSDNNGTGNGGGISQGNAAPTLSNTIVATNIDRGGEAPDCSGSIFTMGYNLIGKDTGCAITTAAAGDRIGTSGSPIDPLLAPLGDNGGPTPTHAPLNDSPALNNGSVLLPGSSNGACEVSDQRGISRAANVPCDIGAYEYAPGSGRTFTVNSALDQIDANIGDGVCETTTSSNICTLRAAVQESNALMDSDNIVVPTGNYTLTLTGSNETKAASGDLNITDGVTITGAGSDTTVIDGNATDRIFTFSASTNSSLSSLTLRNGNLLSSNGSGGAIYQVTGNLTINDSVIDSNSAGYGGGLYAVSSATLTLNRSIVRGNSASGYGGGICNFTFATTQINASTVSGNTAPQGGGLFNSFMSRTTITGSTFSGNSATYGGAIHTQFGRGVVALINTTLSGNTAAISGGALDITRADDSVDLSNVTITNNHVSSASLSSGGGGISSLSTLFTLRNTLIAGNTDAGAIAPDCAGAFTSQGYNLIGDSTGCTFNLFTGDQIGTQLAPIDPRLAPLADNTGPAFTHALLSNSPALNTGSPFAPGGGVNACETRDQRGVDRAVNAPCDIGATEMRLADLNVAQHDSADPVLPNASLTYTITVTNNGSEDANSVVMVDTLPLGATLTDVVAADWICDGNAPVLTCSLANLVSGQTSILEITVSLTSNSGVHTNNATVSGVETDINSMNNISSETTTVNAAPVVGGLSDQTYIAGDPALTIAPGATVSDSDSGELTHAIVRLTAGYKLGTDVLSFLDTPTLIGLWDAASGALTLTGVDSVAAYEAALRSVRFASDGTVPLSGVRNIDVTVNDGNVDSATIVSQLTVSATEASPPYTPAPDPAPEPIPQPAPTPIPEPTPSVTADTLAASTDPIYQAPLFVPGAIAMRLSALSPPNENVSEVATTTSDASATALSSAESRPGERLGADITQPIADPTTSDPMGSKPGPADYVSTPTPHTGGTLGARSNANTTLTNTTRDLVGNKLSTFTTGSVTLVNNTLLWRQLDAMKRQMQGALEEHQRHERIVVGAAKGATLFAFAGTVNWMLKSSSMLAGVLSSLPLWTQFDPLAVLSLTRRERKQRKEERRANARKDDADYGTLGRILEKRALPRNEAGP